MLDQDHFLTWQEEHQAFLSYLYRYYEHLSYSQFIEQLYQGYNLERLLWLEEHLPALEELYRDCCPEQLDYPMASFLDLAYCYSNKNRKRVRGEW